MIDRFIPGPTPESSQLSWPHTTPENRSDSLRGRKHQLRGPLIDLLKMSVPDEISQKCRSVFPRSIGRGVCSGGMHLQFITKSSDLAPTDPAGSGRGLTFDKGNFTVPIPSTSSPSIVNARSLAATPTPGQSIPASHQAGVGRSTRIFRVFLFSEGIIVKVHRSGIGWPFQDGINGKSCPAYSWIMHYD